MPKIWHIPKLLSLHLWVKLANINASHEVAPINDVARITAHTRRRRHCPITYTELATWTNYSKKKYIYIYKQHQNV